MTYDLPYSRSCEWTKTSESEPLGIWLHKHQWFLEPCQWPSDFSCNLLSPKYHPQKKKQMNTPFKLHKSCLAVFVPSISGSVFLGLETQGARCWTCLWNALEILGCQVKARKECQMVGCFETKNPGVLAWLTVSLYHFKLAYVMLKGHMSKFHTRRVG